jgi:hypothetical protein
MHAVVLAESPQVVGAELPGSTRARRLHVEGVGERPAVVVPAPGKVRHEQREEQPQPGELELARQQAALAPEVGEKRKSDDQREEHRALGPGHGGEGEGRGTGAALAHRDFGETRSKPSVTRNVKSWVSRPPLHQQA